MKEKDLSDCAKCILCDRHQTRLIRHLSTQHQIPKPIAYLFRSFCKIFEEEWYSITIESELTALSFDEMSKYIKKPNILKVFDTFEKKSQATEEIRKLFDKRLISRQTENQQQLIIKLRKMMKYFSEIGLSMKTCSIIATSIKHLLEYEKDSSGLQCKEILDLFSVESINDLANKEHLKPCTKYIYSCGLLKVLKYLMHDYENNNRFCKVYSLVNDIKIANYMFDLVEELDEEFGIRKQWKQQHTTFVWDIVAKRRKIAENVSNSQHETNIDETNRLECEKNRKKVKRLFDKKYEDVIREFYIVLYKQIVDKYPDGLTKNIFYQELNQFQSDIPRLRHFKQKVLNLPDRKAYEKLNTFLRTRDFVEQVDLYFQNHVEYEKDPMECEKVINDRIPGNVLPQHLAGTESKVNEENMERIQKNGSKKVIFNKKDEDAGREFYMILYKQILDKYPGGVTKKNFYRELNQFPPDLPQFKILKQKILDLPGRSALDKMHTFIRSKNFIDQVDLYFQNRKELSKKE